MFFFENMRTNLVPIFTGVTVHLLSHKQEIRIATCRFQKIEDQDKLRKGQMFRFTQKALKTSDPNFYGQLLVACFY